jgi:hypothetical protein
MSRQVSFAASARNHQPATLPSTKTSTSRVTFFLIDLTSGKSSMTAIDDVDGSPPEAESSAWIEGEQAWQQLQ